MSMKDFDLKYRGSKIEHMIGNEDIVTSFLSMQKENNFSHKYMFIGPSGCGKTTFARIAAKMCGCTTVLEYDLGSNSKIDDTRQIAEDAKRRNIREGNKAIILDECHNLLAKAQGPLLKAIEEPNEEVYWILITTNPEKLLKTIKTRPMTFKVKPLSDEDMFFLLARVYKAEKIEPDMDLIGAIIQHSEGVPREALLLLQSVIHVEDPQFAIEMVKKRVLGIEEGDVGYLFGRIMDGNVKMALKKLENIKENPESTRRILCAIFKSRIMKSSNMNTKNILFRKATYFVDNYNDSGDLGLVLSIIGACNE